MLDLNTPFSPRFLNIATGKPVPPASSVTIGDLPAGKIGDVVARPLITANGLYESATWGTSDEAVLHISTAPRGVKLVGAGTASITVTLHDATGADLATVTKEYTITA